jgi:hypothetical protein
MSTTQASQLGVYPTLTGVTLQIQPAGSAGEWDHQMTVEEACGLRDALEWAIESHTRHLEASS